MTGPVSMWFAVPVIVLLCLVAVARWFLVDETAADRLINWALSWSAIGVLAEVGGADSEFAWLTHGIFIVSGPLTLAAVYGLARLFDGADPRTAGERQRVYNAVAGSGAVLIVLTDEGPGGWWHTACWLLILNLPMTLAGLHTVRAAGRELRGAALSARARLANTGLLLVAAYWCFAAVAGAVSAAAGGADGIGAGRWTVASCGVCLVVTALAAIPLITVLVARGGLDRTGRDLRRLRPLWRDLTTVVPEIVLRQGDPGGDADSRLYRMVVETRDALQHLRRYVPPGESRENSIESYARQLARAAHAKASGSTPPAGTADGYLHDARDVMAELGHLLDLARVWPMARAALNEPRASRR
ncbi:MAB_1171c family putative transporter [Nocardia sp. NPDC049526]|uniref:MAB_1171c family putative transporter n=1 Tax=Nocardia sp. NPDC049526 TaxID=3364316 RepID=UPI00378F6904